MRLVHLSDLHLGFRQYQRLTPGGINQREADVARSFQQAVDRIITLAPELVVVGGDVFHNVRPTNPAILHAFNQFARLKTALPDTIVVIVAGNHDTPRAAETGCILQLFRETGAHVVDREPRRLYFPEHDLAILAVPDAFVARPALTPDGNARRNVLLLHGEVEGVLPPHVAAAERAAVEITQEELGAARWTYVALGHYHVYRAVAPNAYYSGSIDYTSANSWGERIEERESGIAGKGFIEHDLDSGEHIFHPLAPSRALLDLGPVVVRGLSAAEVDERIRALVESVAGGIEDKIVRIVLADLPRHIERELDHKQLRDFKRRALHFQLESRRPNAAPRSASGAPGRRPSLLEVVRDKLQGRMIESDIDRDALVELGVRYLREAESATAPPAAVLEG